MAPMQDPATAARTKRRGAEFASVICVCNADRLPRMCAGTRNYCEARPADCYVRDAFIFPVTARPIRRSRPQRALLAMTSRPGSRTGQCAPATDSAPAPPAAPQPGQRRRLKPGRTCLTFALSLSKFAGDQYRTYPVVAELQTWCIWPVGPMLPMQLLAACRLETWREYGE